MSTLRVRERLIPADRCRFHRPGSDRLTGLADTPIDAILPTDAVFTRGTQAYARERAGAA